MVTKRLLVYVYLVLTAGLTIGLMACGGGGGGDAGPSISIKNPTSEPSYETSWTSLSIGGTISGASFVHVENTMTGFTTDGYVTYNQGDGSWFADIYGLAPGENLIIVTADSDGTGMSTAQDQIIVIRPLQPVSMIFNGKNNNEASSFWIDIHSIGESHKIAIFADGTGKSTTGSLLTENAGAVTDFTWNLLDPDAILVSNCATCSFQKISRIQGSFDDGSFMGQIETVGGEGELALHLFVLESGDL